MTYRKIDISRRWLVSEDAAKEFIDHRINIKKPLTQRAFERAMAAASDGPDKLGMPVDWVIEKTIDQGWQGVNLEWLVPHTDRVLTHRPTRSIRDIPIEEQLSDRSWANPQYRIDGK